MRWLVAFFHSVEAPIGWPRPPGRADFNWTMPSAARPAARAISGGSAFIPAWLPVRTCGTPGATSVRARMVRRAHGITSGPSPRRLSDCIWARLRRAGGPHGRGGPDPDNYPRGPPAGGEEFPLGRLAYPAGQRLHALAIGRPRKEKCDRCLFLGFSDEFLRISRTRWDSTWSKRP
jgi:hypothetical protein